jgi:hypothetical protein
MIEGRTDAIVLVPEPIWPLSYWWKWMKARIHTAVVRTFPIDHPLRTMPDDHPLRAGIIRVWLSSMRWHEQEALLL